MVEAFAPEDLKVRGPQGLNFSDAYGLTCAQMGLMLAELLHVEPDARLTREDLIGYHFLQYGMDGETIEGALSALEGGMWDDWDKARPLRDSLPRVVRHHTRFAPVQRIRLGDPQHTPELDPNIYHSVNLVHETDHLDREVTSLYPLEGKRLVYKGRVSVGLGEVVMDHVIMSPEIHSDLLDVQSGVIPTKSMIVASAELTHGTQVQAVRVL